MTQYEESIAKYKNNHDLYELLLFVKNEITTRQCKDALNICDDEELMQYLICVYACYCIPRNMGVPHLITNPQALSSSENERKALLEIIKTAIVDNIETTKAKQKAHKLHSEK